MQQLILENSNDIQGGVAIPTDPLRPGGLFSGTTVYDPTHQDFPG